MGGIGFKYVEAEGMHYFIFLDNFDRMELPSNMEPSLFQVSDGGRLYAYQVDDLSGKYKNQFILDTKDVNGNKLNKLPTVRIFNADKKNLMLEFDMKGKLDNMLKMKIR